MSDDVDIAQSRFAAALQADIRRERRLLLAEIAILLFLLGLAVLRYWVGR